MSHPSARVFLCNTPSSLPPEHGESAKPGKRASLTCRSLKTWTKPLIFALVFKWFLPMKQFHKDVYNLAG